MQFDNLQMQINRKNIDVETVRKFLLKNMEILESEANNLEQCQKLCRNYIDKVTVNSDSIVVHTLFSLSPEKRVGLAGVGDGT